MIILSFNLPTQIRKPPEKYESSVMEARLENKHNSRANWCNKNHNRLYRDSMIEFELEFNIAVEIRLKNTHCMPPWGTSYTVAGPLKPPTMTSLPVGTEVAVTTSMEKRTRARVKKEEIFNIIISDEDWISYNADSYSKGKERREILVECNHLKLIYKSKENEYTWKSPLPPELPPWKPPISTSCWEGKGHGDRPSLSRNLPSHWQFCAGFTLHNDK